MEHTLGVFSKKCVIHKTKKVFGICTAPHCKQRILCLDCKDEHDTCHEVYFHSILEGIVLDIDTEFEDAMKKSADLRESKKEDLERLEQSFDKIMEKVKSAVDQVKKSILDSTGLSTIDKGEWDKLKAEIQEKLDKCLQTKENNEELNMKILTEFSEAYTRFTFKKTDLERLQSKNKLFDDALEHRLDVFSDSLESALLSLTDLSKYNNSSNNFQNQSYLSQTPLKSNRPSTMGIDPFMPNLHKDKINLKGCVEVNDNVDCFPLRYIPEYDLFAIGDQTGLLMMCEGGTLAPLCSIQVDAARITKVEFTRSIKDYIIVSSQKGLRVFSVNSQPEVKLLKTLYQSRAVFDVTLAESKQIFFSGGADADVDIWDMHTLKSLGKIRTSNRGNIWAMLYLEHKELLVVGFYWSKIGIYDVNSKAPFQMVESGYTNFWIYSMAYDYEKNLLYVPVHEQKIRCWEIQETEAKFVREFDVPGDPIKIELINRGTELLFTSGSADLYAIDLQDEKLKIEVKVKSKKFNHIDSVYFIPQRNRFILSSWYQPFLEVYNYTQ